MFFIGSSYIDDGFKREQVKSIVSSFRACIDDKIYGNFDAIACRGTSGLLIAPILAYEFDLKLMVVRKPNDNSHSYSQLETFNDVKKYVVVDDFVASGRTLEAITDVIQKNESKLLVRPTYVGAYFWYEGRSMAKETIFYGDESRFHKIAKGKVFAQRTGSNYLLDRMNEAKFLNENRTVTAV